MVVLIKVRGGAWRGEGIQRGLPGAGRVLPLSPDVGHTGVCLVRNHEVVRLCLCIVLYVCYVPQYTRCKMTDTM